MIHNLYHFFGYIFIYNCFKSVDVYQYIAIIKSINNMECVDLKFMHNDNKSIEVDYFIIELYLILEINH